jgi:hypothetical protein
MAGQMALSPADGPEPEDRAHSRLVPWEQLPDRARAKYAEAARVVPATLAGVGFQVLRDDRAHDGPGQADFTAEEWAIMEQAMMTAGVLVSLAEGGVDADEIFALVKKLREASIAHPRRFIRELAAASAFSTGLRAGARYADYEAPALAAIRAATAIIACKAPAELPGFRLFLAEIAMVVADANKEGGFLGVGAHRRTRDEAAAIEAVSRATGLEGLPATLPTGTLRPARMTTICSIWPANRCVSHPPGAPAPGHGSRGGGRRPGRVRGQRAGGPVPDPHRPEDRLGGTGRRRPARPHGRADHGGDPGRPGVVGVGQLRLRWIGHQTRAEREIVVDPDITAAQAHEVTVSAEHALPHAIPRLSDALVHADPAAGGTDPHEVLADHRPSPASAPGQS